MHRTIAALAAAAVAAGSITGLVVLGGPAAAATTAHPTGRSSPHTLTIKVSGLDGGGQQTRSGFVATSKVTTLDNTFLGYEVDSGSFGTSGITDRIAIALDGGILYCTTTSTPTGEDERGTVTGGAGEFAGARGTIVGNSFDKEAQVATYTITWRR